jgi:hypothetical protein
MVTVALLVRLEAKPGKEQEVAELLSGGLPIFERNRRSLRCSASASA